MSVGVEFKVAIKVLGPLILEVAWAVIKEKCKPTPLQFSESFET